MVSLSLSTASFASDFSYDIQHFNYEEFENNNLYLDEAHRQLPGVKLGMEWQWPDWYLSVDSSLSSGMDEYSRFSPASKPGFDGAPIDISATDTFIVDSLLTSGYRFGTHKHNYSSLYAGLGYQFLYRGNYDGQDVGSAASKLDQSYASVYAALGGKWAMFNGQNLGGALDIQARHTLAGQSSRAASGREQADYALGNDWSVRLSLPFQYVISKGSSLTLQPYVETWDLGETDAAKRSLNDPSTANSYLDPNSDNRNIGVWFTYDKQY